MALRDAVCDGVAPEALRRGREKALESLDGLGPWDWQEVFGTVRVPALIVEAAGDDLAADCAARWAQYLGDGRVLFLGEVIGMPWHGAGGSRVHQAVNTFLAGSWPEGTLTPEPFDRLHPWHWRRPS
jgi:hypothetical protein